jgi:antibiotic biosynthesis monooxygenase (ABM) superfamily enzyme
MECNAGTCPPQEFLEICWTLVGDKKNVDASQVWFMPLADDVFAAWLTSQNLG